MTPENTFHPDDNGIRTRGIFGLPYAPDEAQLIIIPAPWEVTVTSRRGTAHAPQKIIETSPEIDLYFHPYGEPWKAGIATVPFPESDYQTNLQLRTIVEEIYLQIRQGKEPSDIPTIQWIDQENQGYLQRLQLHIRQWHDHGKIIGLIGGEHSIALAGMRAAIDRYPKLGVLQIDAHADLRTQYLGLTTSHASVFRRLIEHAPEVTLVQVGLRDVSVGEKQTIDQFPNIHAHFARDIHRQICQDNCGYALIQRIIAPLPENVYISFDIDGLDIGYCPHTGTPVPGGISFRYAVMLIEAIVESGRRIVGFDLCEVGDNPLDIQIGVFTLFHLSNYTLLSNN